MSTKSFILSSLCFLLGAAGGAVGGYYYSKNKFLTIADKEIESVRKVYEKHFENNNTNESIELKEEKNLQNIQIGTKTPQEKDYNNYVKYVKMYGGSDDKKPSVTPTRSIAAPKGASTVKKTKNNNIYVISPEQYQDSEYDAESLIYYSDKVLTDSDGNVIHDINSLIGPEALSTFGRYEDDVVYVRDDDKRIDYEIIWDARKYSSVHNLEGSKVPLDSED